MTTINSYTWLGNQQNYVLATNTNAITLGELSAESRWAQGWDEPLPEKPKNTIIMEV